MYLIMFIYSYLELTLCALLGFELWCMKILQQRWRQRKEDEMSDEPGQNAVKLALFINEYFGHM